MTSEGTDVMAKSEQEVKGPGKTFTIHSTFKQNHAMSVNH